MKKTLRILPIMLCIVLSVFVFAACSDHGAPEHKVEPRYSVTEEAALNNLKEFMQGRENRTAYTSRERDAAEWLVNKMTDCGYDVEVKEFTAEENNVKDLTSQNVVAKLYADNRSAETKNIVIGAYYDNRFSSAYQGSSGDRSPAALNGGTGVASVLSVAEYLAAHKTDIKLDFDVTVVFFGASYYSSVGAQAFYDGMTGDEISDTVLMVEMQRIGCDHVYAFSDARETKREAFFDGVAKKSGLDIYKATQKSPLITGMSSLNGVPYYQWAHGGVFDVFFNNNIPTLNLVGANWETVDINNAESKDNDNISFTAKDDIETLLRLYPDCGKKMATACTLVVNSLVEPDFVEVMEYDRKNFPDTDILTKQWIWYLVVLGAMIVAGAVMFAVVSHLGKKYPVEIPKPRKMKMAVFGMDYEDGKSDDIFIDLRDPFESDEIFPGIKNNERSNNVTTNEDIFPPYEKPRQPDERKDPSGEEGDSQDGGDGNDDEKGK